MMIVSDVPQIPMVDFRVPSKTRRKSDKIQAILTEDGAKSFICPVCAEVFTNNHNLTRHIRQHNKPDTTASIPTNTCKICAKVLCSQSSLDRHMLVHSGERPYKCNKCGMTFTTNGNMHRHMRIHRSDVDDIKDSKPQRVTWKSDDGDLKNSKPASRGNKRKRDVSGTDDTPAAKRFALGDGAEIEKLQSLDVDQLSCPVCAMPFKTKDSLEEHLDNHPSEPTKCHFCQSVFPSPSRLYIHYMISHTSHRLLPPQPEAARPRPQAHRDINNYYINARHVNVGFDNLNFVDVSCEKFPLVAKDWCEKNACHPRSPLNSYLCARCNQVFPCEEALKLHVESHIPAFKSDCDECKVTFSSSQEYEDHKAQHRDDKIVDEYVSHRGANDNDLQDLVPKDDFMLVMGLKKTETAGDMVEEKRPTPILPTMKLNTKSSQYRVKSMPILKKMLEKSDQPMPSLLPSLPPPLTQMTRKECTPVKHHSTPRTVVCKACGEGFEQVHQLKEHLMTSAMCCSNLFQMNKDSFLHKRTSVKPNQFPSRHTRQDDIRVGLKKLESSIKQEALDEPLDMSMKNMPSTTSATTPLDFSMKRRQCPAQFNIPRPGPSVRIPVPGCPPPPPHFGLKPLPMSMVPASTGGMRLPVMLPNNPTPYVIQPVISDVPQDLSMKRPWKTDDSLAPITNLAKVADPTAFLQHEPLTALRMAMNDHDQYENTTTATDLTKRSAYAETPSRHQCPQCHRCFPWMSSLKRHLMTHTGMKPFKCPVCPVSFTTKSNRERHVTQIHSMDVQQSNVKELLEKPYACDSCFEGAFDTAIALLEHYKEYHTDCKVPKDVLDQAEDELKPKVVAAWSLRDASASGFGSRATGCQGEIQCPSSPVSERSSSSPAPSSNIDIVTVDHPFNCTVCEESHATRVEVLQHIKHQHPAEWCKIQIKNNITSVDEFAQSQENLVQERITRMSNESTGSGDGHFSRTAFKNRKFHCTFCPKRFPYIQDLKRHVRSHTGEQPFQCNICMRRFTLKHSMLRHRKTHLTSAAREEAFAMTGSSEEEEMSNVNMKHVENKAASPDVAIAADQSSLLHSLLGVEDSQLSVMLDSADAAAEMLGM